MLQVPITTSLISLEMAETSWVAKTGKFIQTEAVLYPLRIQYKIIQRVRNEFKIKLLCFLTANISKVFYQINRFIQTLTLDLEATGARAWDPLKTCLQLIKPQLVVKTIKF